MRRLLIAGLLVLALGAAASALADTPGGRLRGFVCQQALDPAARAVSVTAVMRPVPGTARMAIRFELLKRTRHWGRWVSLAGSGLRGWTTPKDPTLGSEPGDRWVVKHPVVDLAGPAWYRFRVTFRWSGASGHTIGRSVRESPVCFQPELRADLRVMSVQATPLSSEPGVDRYSAVIRNAGKTAAGQFKVELLDGSAQYKTVPRLLPQHQVQVSFDGPACSASSPATITADPLGQVDDANRTNNSMATSCS